MQNKCKIINISTDCVFDGKKGNYSENSNDLAKDIYGVSKYLGELQSYNNLTLRTSIIGHEIKNKFSLLEWFINNKNKDVDGYKNVFFSGVTTNELTRIINLIINKFQNLNGIYHISSTKISKFDLLTKINEIYKLEKNIKSLKNKRLDRSLNSQKFRKITRIKIKSWSKMITEMYHDKINLN